MILMLWYSGIKDKVLIPYYHLTTMASKQKTSINIDPEIWNKWLHFVLDKTGSTRKVSDEFEKALKFYMENKKVE